MSSLVGLAQLGGMVDVVRIVCYERTETGSSPVTSTKGDEQSSLTRDDKMADHFWISGGMPQEELKYAVLLSDL